MRCLENHGKVRERGTVLTSTSSSIPHAFNRGTNSDHVRVEWPTVNNVRCPIFGIVSCPLHRQMTITTLNWQLTVSFGRMSDRPLGFPELLQGRALVHSHMVGL